MDATLTFEYNVSRQRNYPSCIKAKCCASGSWVPHMKRAFRQIVIGQLTLPATILVFSAIFLVGPALTHELLAEPHSPEKMLLSDSARTSSDRSCPRGANDSQGRMVYLRNCQACHGLCGEGNGAYAPTLRAKPRDFTAGVYKWRSTPTGALPTDEDLMRTLSRGVPESGMPAFSGMPERDRLALIAYIKSLSPRFSNEPAEKPLTIPPEPAMTIGSIKKGRQAYEQLGCAACHGTTGDGRGPLATELLDDDGNPIRPADLTGTAWKGGCLGQDIYRSILTGLDGTPMPSYEKQLHADEVWPLVHYIQSLEP